MKIVKLILLVVLLCPYKSAHGADGVDKSQSSGANSLRASPGTQASTPSSGTTTPSAKSSGTNLKPVTLDITKTRSTNDCLYSDYGNYATFNPKPGHGFSKIVKRNKAVWTAKDDYATGVFLKDLGDKKKELSISLGDKVIILKKEGRKKPWIDITSKRNGENPNANDGSATVDPSNASSTGVSHGINLSVHSSDRRPTTDPSGRRPAEDSSARRPPEDSTRR
ncbi:hypothetical protein TpMuguga_04g00095 [Theileria parva strain Muguga]|uniref:Uncharacterized protein n=1 Tax=Theileria parva TaxID=5875 RepID=Q4N392_THEPA|nr:uncharacterized protein TpMuguga_04g00095 [Theileria parva strain Muguga]EAN31447.1 hypothetical protein TpMuguga_04g00095 [Theileria parva strain Muguga]|eukprot:XP_763730.1 hypothetical protein [Theileria parva strain Muguga]